MLAKVDDISMKPLSGRRGRPLYEAISPPAADESAIVGETIPGGTFSPQTFAQQQLRALIRRVFFPGWSKASRQVVVCGADSHCDTADVCTRMVREMANGLPGTVCAVEADVHSPGVARTISASVTECPQTLGNGSISAGENLWLIKPESMIGRQENDFDAAWLRTRMSELRREFDYTVIHAPPAFRSEAVVLGQLADGVILVIEAHRTHRSVALRSMEILKGANVAVLGTVLTERTFPIPEKLYQSL